MGSQRGRWNWATELNWTSLQDSLHSSVQDNTSPKQDEEGEFTRDILSGAVADRWSLPGDRLLQGEFLKTADKGRATRTLRHTCHLIFQCYLLYLWGKDTTFVENVWAVDVTSYHTLTPLSLHLKWHTLKEKNIFSSNVPNQVLPKDSWVSPWNPIPATAPESGV